MIFNVILTRQVQKCVEMCSSRRGSAVMSAVMSAILQRGEASVDFWILHHSHQTNGELGSGSLRHRLRPRHHLLDVCSNIFECIVCAVVGGDLAALYLL